MKLGIHQLDELRELIDNLNDLGLAYFTLTIHVYESTGAQELIGSIAHSDEEGVGFYFASL